jgi:hypothetical protein
MHSIAGCNHHNLPFREQSLSQISVVLIKYGGRSLVYISSSTEHLGWYGRECRETNLTRSEEKQIESQFEQAKSLCTNPVRMFMDRLMLYGLVILTLPFCWILLQAQKVP